MRIPDSIRRESGLIFKEALILAFVFLVLGFSSAAFWHAEAGAAWDFSALQGVFAIGSSGAAPIRDAPANSAGQVAASPVLLPAAVHIAASFIPQAPLGDWSLPYREACEEASAAMAVAWARGAQSVSPAEANLQILAQVRFENQTFGHNRDTTASETARIITDFYRYPAVAVRELRSSDDIRAELARGNLVILPTAGEQLHNPYYAGLPPYHMVVAVGYDAEGNFIVHDPGTRRGADYPYSAAVLWDAIHDWTGSDATILEGAKRMIVVSPGSASAGP